MEINLKFEFIFKKFDEIKGELRPQLNLTESEMCILIENKTCFILNVLNKYSASDSKRLFMLTHYVWFHINHKELICILEINKDCFNKFFALFSFLYDIIRLNMYDVLYNQLNITNTDIITFLRDKEDEIRFTSIKESIDLKYIPISNLSLLKIRESLVR